MIALDECRSLVESMHRYVSREVTEEEKLRVERHLQTCRRCQDSLQRLREVRGLLQGALAGDAAGADRATSHSRLREVSTGPRLAVAAEAGELEAPAEAPAGSLNRLAARFGAAPWWIVSGAFHALLILLLFLIGLVILDGRQKDTVTITSLVKQQEKAPEKEPPTRDILKNPTPLETQTLDPQPEVVLHQEVEVAEHNETADEADSNEAFGDEGISDIPLGGSGFSGALGIGGGGSGAFGRPTGAGGRLRRAKAGGGGQATESAVDAALAWLARHQEAGGHWDGPKYGGVRPAEFNQSMTGLAVLAFLGAGHTDRAGRFKDTVQRGLAWLLKHHEEQHRGSDYNLYHAAIATLALAEAHAMTRNPQYKEAAQKGVTFLASVQGDYGGWAHGSHRSTSVLGWCVMALKSAKVAGVKVPPQAFEGALRRLKDMSEQDADGYFGRVAYEGSAADRSFRKDGYNMTAVGMTCFQFLGLGAETSRQAEILGQAVPQWAPARQDFQSFYYWYAGTLGMFQHGGAAWKTWNEALKATLLPNQRKGGPKDGSLEDVDGSWDVITGCDKAGGRVQTTALGALCLEVYYRYLPLYR